MNGTPELRLHSDHGAAPPQPGLLSSAVVQLFLFRGDRYLGWDCFAKDMVLVGGEPGDDLTLEGLEGSGTRLVVYVDHKRVVVHDPSGSGAIRVNDEPLTTRVLGPLDVVTVGSYSLKARLEQIGPVEPARQEPATLATATPPVQAEPPPTTPSAERQTPQIATPGAQEQTPPATPESPPVDQPAARQTPIQVTDWDEAPPEGLDDPHALELFHALVEQATESAEAGKTRDIVRVEFEEPPVPADPPAAEAVPAQAAVEIEVPEPEPQPVIREPEPVVVELPRTVPTTPLPEAAPEAFELLAPVADIPIEPQPPALPTAQPVAAVKPQSLPQRHAGWTMPAPVFVPDDEPDEDELEDREASFSLVDLALWNPAPDTREQAAGSLLQVARTRSGQLVDLVLLDHDQPYRLPSAPRRTRPLARRDKAGRSTLTLNREQARGEIRFADDRRRPLAELLTPETRISRRGDLFRVALPRGAQARIQLGSEELIIHEVPRRQSPKIAAGPQQKKGLGRNLASSALVHVLLLMVGSLFLSLPTPEEPPPETRFVQLDPEQLKPPAPEPPKAKPKPKPAAPIQVAQTPKAKPKPAAAPKPTPEKAKPGPNPALASNQGKGPTSAAASPDAGGGHGGNVRNRNVKQAGILGALGIPDGINLGATQAMAAVTNIDAVSSTRSSEGALKVGGLVGSLGSDRVEMPAVGLVNTRGSTRAVASAGIGGSGTVAALERGKTGETQVRAMVKADIKVPASVSGGMSREEVKRVIDEHMDEVSYCYETALIEDAGLMGRMAFEWKIQMSGRVGEVRIQSSSIQSDPLHACIKRAIQTWKFPEPRGAEVLVSYPFVFDVVGF